MKKKKIFLSIFVLKVFFSKLRREKRTKESAFAWSYVKWCMIHI